MTSVNMVDGKSPRTKKMLADTLIHLSKTIPIQKIHINDLCRECGLKRQSFYYHFKDKYELVEWIFFQDFYTGMKVSPILNSEEMIYSVLKSMDTKRDFYHNLFTDNSQNNIKEFLISLYIKLETNTLKEYLHTEMLDDDLVYAVQSYSYACMEHHRQWFLQSYPMSIEKLAHQFYKSMPDILKSAYTNNQNKLPI